MQAWEKHKKQPGCAKKSKSKACFRQKLKRCIEEKLIKEVCLVNMPDESFMIYEFLDKVSGNEHLMLFYVFVYFNVHI